MLDVLRVGRCYCVVGDHREGSSVEDHWWRTAACIIVRSSGRIIVKTKQQLRVDTDVEKVPVSVVGGSAVFSM